MTTIAFDGRYFSADSRTVGNFIDQKGFDKIKVIHRKTGDIIVSGAGDLSLMLAFFEYIEGRRKEFPLVDPDSFVGMVYDVKNKQLTIYENLMIPIPVSSPYSIGSGSDFAMGAMMAGANSIEAVEIASKLDSGTGGDINFVDVLDLSEVKPRASKRNSRKQD